MRGKTSPTNYNCTIILKIAAFNLSMKMPKKRCTFIDKVLEKFINRDVAIDYELIELIKSILWQVLLLNMLILYMGVDLVKQMTIDMV